MPLSQATRLLAKILLNAQLQRGIEIRSNPPTEIATLLLYSDTEELRQAREQACKYTRESMDDEQTRWLHQLQRAMAAGAVPASITTPVRAPTNRDNADRGRTPTRQRPQPTRRTQPEKIQPADKRPEERRSTTSSSRAEERRVRVQDSPADTRPRQPTDNNWSKIQRSKWQETYGSCRAADGTQEQLCFYFANCPSGCRRSGDEC